MTAQQETNYSRIAEAISYIKNNFKNQPQLDEVAEKINVSPYHFQRMFTEWAGVSPKKFLQYITVAHAKKMLKETQATLFDTALESGLSGSSRLHDLFVNIEGMTPGEYKTVAKTSASITVLLKVRLGMCWSHLHQKESAILLLPMMKWRRWKLYVTIFPTQPINR